MGCPLWFPLGTKEYTCQIFSYLALITSLPIGRLQLLAYTPAGGLSAMITCFCGSAIRIVARSLAWVRVVSISQLIQTGSLKQPGKAKFWVVACKMTGTLMRWDDWGFYPSRNSDWKVWTLDPTSWISVLLYRIECHVSCNVLLKHGV